MSNYQIYLYGISVVLALIPALIWLVVLLRDSKHRGLQLLIFFMSIFSVVPVFLLQYFLNLFPQFDIVQFLQAHIHDQNLNYIILFISVGVVEEIVKQSIVRIVDKKYLLIQTINDSIKYSLVAALAFSFAENIFYIYAIYSQLGIEQLIIAYLFRSMFTTPAHLIFSGFFGYYYGIAKFSMNIIEEQKLEGKKHLFQRFIARVMDMSRVQAFKEVMILKGLFVAIFMHATFNFLLQLNIVVPVTIYVMLGFLYLKFLLKRRSGKLILVTDVSESSPSSIAKRDEDVVIELLGMWFQKKRFVDVLHICQRLLERDPDNKVVQLFKEKALEKLSDKSPYKKILMTIFPHKKQKSIVEMVKERPVMSAPVIDVEGKKVRGEKVGDVGSGEIRGEKVGDVGGGEVSEEKVGDVGSGEVRGEKVGDVGGGEVRGEKVGDVGGGEIRGKNGGDVGGGDGSGSGSGVEDGGVFKLDL